MVTTFFEQPVPDAWVAPCRLADLRRAFSTFPDEDVRALHAVGLAAATRKDWSAFGRYFHTPRPTIRLYSLPAALCYRQPPHVKRVHLEQMAAMEFGMIVEPSGSRWVCRWTADGIRRYTLEYVVAHEIGHHVYTLRHGYPKNRREWEQFAYDYAMRRFRAG